MIPKRFDVIFHYNVTAPLQSLFHLLRQYGWPQSHFSRFSLCCEISNTVYKYSPAVPQSEAVTAFRQGYIFLTRLRTILLFSIQSYTSHLSP